MGIRRLESLVRPAQLLVEALLLAGLVAVSLAAVIAHQRNDSPTSDEAIHLFSGAEALEDGSGWLNPEHPPLLKLAGAFALRPLGLLTPCEITPCTSSPFGGYSRWLYGNRAPAHAIVAAGRRPFPWVLALLVVALHFLVRPLAGPAAGLLAAGLVAFDPTFVAHAAYVHTDVGASLAFLLVAVLCVRAAFGTTLGPWLLLGLALGLALVTKFSTVLLVPVVAVSPVFGLFRRRGDSGAPGPSRVVTRDRVVGALLALGIAALVVQGVYGAILRRMTPELAEASIRSYLQGRPARPDEIERYAGFARISPPLGHYLAGAKGVALLSERGRGANYFRGEVSDRGFLLYFPAALLLKSTPAFLALLAFALALVVLRLRRGGPLPDATRMLAVLLPVGLATVLLLVSMRSAFNIGARHLLPVWVLLVFAGAVVVGLGLATRPRLRALTVAVLVGSSGASLLSSGSSPIAYFNGLAGGPAGGREWFSDSNVDWGQDLYRLHLFLAERGWEETTTIVAFGGVATNYYFRNARLLDPGKPLAPGRYAVSHMMETLGTRFTREFEGEAAARQVDELVKALKKRGRRIALVGGSITIWELPG
ncbi:MAG TPA: glycosyltransferase family 39 protein [Thermoanaerobaculia bacterium]|nr:glycosyltransferase family 39 protein [Thermoanaerobaculia bacterium]